MSFDQLDILESKVNKVVEIIEKMQAEILKYKKENHKLRDVIKKNDKVVKELRNDNKKLNEKVKTSDYYLKNEEKIKDKIKNILWKLDKLQDISSI